MILSQVAEQFDHKPRQLIILSFVDWVLKAVFERRNLRLHVKVLVKVRLRRHITESDTS